MYKHERGEGMIPISDIPDYDLVKDTSEYNSMVQGVYAEMLIRKKAKDDRAYDNVGNLRDSKFIPKGKSKKGGRSIKNKKYNKRTKRKEGSRKIKYTRRNRRSLKK
jgi:hypothetical protein